MARAERVRLHGGPFDGQSVVYPTPLPEVIVMSQVVKEAGRAQPGLRYAEYLVEPNLRSYRNQQPYGPHHYVYRRSGAPSSDDKT